MVNALHPQTSWYAEHLTRCSSFILLHSISCYTTGSGDALYMQWFCFYQPKSTSGLMGGVPCLVHLLHVQRMGVIWAGEDHGCQGCRQSLQTLLQDWKISYAPFLTTSGCWAHAQESQPLKSPSRKWRYKSIPLVFMLWGCLFKPSCLCVLWTALWLQERRSSTGAL